MNIVALLSHSFLLTNLWGEQKKTPSEEALAFQSKSGGKPPGMVHTLCPPAHLPTVLLWRELATNKVQLKKSKPSPRINQRINQTEIQLGDTGDMGNAPTKSSAF